MLSKRWKPHDRHGPGAVKQGPVTRRYVKPAPSKFVLSVLKRLKGDGLARWTTRIANLDPRAFTAVRYDDDRKLYITHDGEDHAFAHPRRITTLYHGHHSRGRDLAYEYQLDQIPFQDGDWVIDVGANSGDLCLAFRALGKKINLEAFEPSPGEFAALTHNLATSSAVLEHKAHQLALWNEASDGLTFYLKPGSADSSVLPIKGASEVVQVPSARLEDVFADDNRQFRLLKLEAEGVEPEVLEGAGDLLTRVHFVAADVGFERGEETASTLPEVTNFMLAKGFEVHGFEHNRMVVLFRNLNLA